MGTSQLQGLQWPQRERVKDHIREGSAQPCPHWGTSCQPTLLHGDTGGSRGLTASQASLRALLWLLRAAAVPASGRACFPAGTGCLGTSAPYPLAWKSPWGNSTRHPPAPHLVPAVSPEQTVGPDVEDFICPWVLQDEAVTLSLEHIGTTQLASLRGLSPLHRHPEGVHCGDREAQGRAEETTSPGKASPAQRSPGDRAAAGEAPQKVAQSRGSGRSHLRLSSSRWSSRPSPGLVPPRRPLCRARPPRQHGWGHSPGKGEKISPSSPIPH